MSLQLLRPSTVASALIRPVHPQRSSALIALTRRSPHAAHSPRPSPPLAAAGGPFRSFAPPGLPFAAMAPKASPAAKRSRTEPPAAGPDSADKCAADPAEAARMLDFINASWTAYHAVGAPQASVVRYLRSRR